jgi:hypothetical protein
MACVNEHENILGAFLVRRNDELVSALLQPISQAELQCVQVERWRDGNTNK